MNGFQRLPLQQARDVQQKMQRDMWNRQKKMGQDMMSDLARRRRAAQAVGQAVKATAEQAGGVRQWLVLVSDKDPRARIEIPAGGLLLGRAVPPPGRLDNDPAVSANHARILWAPDGGLVISDLGSTNGTYVNGMRIVRPQPLRQGDSIQLGQSTLRVEGAASESSRHDPSALLSHAKQLLREGKTYESEAAFRGLLDYPNYASEGYYGLGVISLNRSDPDAAVTSFEQCLRANPQHANALYQFGFIAERRGLMNDALEYYKRSLSADPQHGSAKLRLTVLQRNPGSPRPADAQTIGAPEPAPNLIATPPGQYGVYEYLHEDAAPISRQAIALIDKLDIEVHPPLVAYVGRFLSGVVRSTFIVLLSIASYGVFPLLMLIIGYIKVRTTRLRVKKGRLQIEKGIFNKHLTSVDLWRVHGIELERTLINRMTGDGTLVFLLSPEPVGIGRRRWKHRRMYNQIVEVTGLARKSDLEDTFQQLLNLTFLLRGNPVVKGIIQ